MNCQQVARDELVEKYLNGQLEPALERDFQVHILECPECLALLETCEDIRDDLAPQAATLEQKSEKPFWSLGGLLVPRRTAALAGLVCMALVAVLVGLRTGVIPGRGGNGTDISKGGPMQSASGGQAVAFPEIAALPSAEQPGIWKAINCRNISYPSDLAELRGKQATLLGESPEGASFRVLEPVGEVVIDPRPLFRWPLQRGQVYQWQVTAVMSDGKRVIAPSFPSPKAKFRVIDQAKGDELEQFRLAHPEAHLVLGILYTEAGLLKNGEHELGDIPANSRDFELAQHLLRSIPGLH